MKVDFQTINNILIVVPDGEMDHHSAQKVREETDRAIDAFFIKNLIFDFKLVTFMDSSGIGVLMGRYNKIKDLNGKVGIINCSGHIDKILEMSGLYTIIEKYIDLEHAIKKINM